MTNLAPTTLGTMVLLTDGTVMATGNGGNSSNPAWYKLTPDASGNYANGTWSTLASEPTSRLYTATEVLQDGRVWNQGGEYVNGGQASWSRTGDIYNPATNTWATIPNFPQTQFGDDPSTLLSNGLILAGYLAGAQTYFYNPTAATLTGPAGEVVPANSWLQGPTKVDADRSDEESWTKTIDPATGHDIIVSWDVFAQPNAQKYDFTTGIWSRAGTFTGLSQAGSELGPGFRLADGRVVQIGASPKNAIYNPATNTWAALLNTPSSLGANDAPGAILPNGHILYAAGDTSTAFNAPYTLFDMDPLNNTINAISMVGGPNPSGVSPFTTRMLTLPTGQILFAPTSNRLYVYTGDGSPDDSSRPVIGNIVSNGSSFTLTGSQLNGISQGASYGDDAEMASNYPIVRLTNAAGNVFYAKSTNWNKTGVGANGATSVQFTLPTAIANGGTFKVEVVGAGISSKPVIAVFMGSTTGNAVTLQTDPGNSANIQSVSSDGTRTFSESQFVGAFVLGTSAADTITVQTNFTGLPTVVSAGAGNDVINVNATGSAITVNAEDNDDIINVGGGNMDSNITANVSVVGGNGNDTVNFNDAANGAAGNYTLNSTSVSKTSQPSVSYSFSAELLTLTGGTNNDTINVNALSIPATVNGGGGDDSILVALSSNPVTAQGGAGSNDTVFVVGSGAGDTITVSSTTVGGAANISYGSDVENLEIDGNGSGDTITVNSTSASTAVKLDGGAAADSLDVEGSSSTVTVVDSAGGDTVTVNNAAAQFSGSGNTVNIVNVGGGGSLDASSGAIDFNSLNLSGGSLTGSSDITINSNMSWTGGQSSGTGSLIIGAAATMTDSVPGTSRSKALNMLGSGSLAAGGARLLVTSGFSFSGAGVLDLNDNDMIVDYASGPQIDNIVAAIVSARDGGAWDGPGLTSTAAKNASPHVTTLGAMETTDYKTINPGATTFDGELVDNTSVVIKYTYYGDANFNGKVDGTDYAHIDSTFNQEHTAGNIGGWMNGDNNYDGKVNGSDYAFIDSAFNAQGSTVLRASVGGNNSASTIVGSTNPVGGKTGKTGGGIAKK